MPHLLLVTGMSGAGKSTVLDALEDMGWDTVDNLPTALLHDFVHGPDRPLPGAHVAVGMDARSRGFDPVALPALLRSIPGVRPEILYLDATGAELIRRYGETRRRHPLAPDRPAEDGIARERQLTSALRLAADSVLDTTDLRVPDLRPLTGADGPVADFVASQEGWAGFMDRTEELLAFLLPRYWEAGKSYASIAFGCTGGRHRSVAAAIAMGERLRKRGFSPNIRHRDLSLRPDDSLEQGQARMVEPKRPQE